MRSIKVVSPASANGHVFLAPMAAKPGLIGKNLTYEVTEIPDGVSDAEVLRVFSGTADATQCVTQRYSFRFSELGIGRLIRA